MDERELVAGCKRGEPWACREIYELHAPAMMGVCMRYVHDRETAKDILQEGFIKVYTKLHTYSEKGSLAAWMRRVFVTTALEYLRQTDALKLSTSIDDHYDSFENSSISAVERLTADELMACIGRLPQGYQTIFNLFAIEGYSHSEIASMLNIKESTSRSQFLRGRKLLQEIVLSLTTQENAKQREKQTY